MRLQLGRELLLIEVYSSREVVGIGLLDFHDGVLLSFSNFRIALDWMEDKHIRLMHNSHDVHAFRETAPPRLEPPDYIRSDCGGKKRYGGSIPATADPAGGKQSVAARSHDVSRRSGGQDPEWVGAHVAGTEDPIEA